MTATDLRSYHPDRQSLFNPALGPSLFEQVPAPSLACTCAELSRLAYASLDGESPKLRHALQAGALELLATFSVNGAQAFAVRLPGGQVCIAFRGTQADDPTDLGTDADLRLVEHERIPGRVHAGFARSFLGLMPKLEEFLRQAAPAAPPVLTGHSLGAALATLAASVFPGCHLITFGSPRVGDARFANGSLAVETERYVDCSDVVTEVPPAKLLGYAHLGRMRYIDRNGVLHGEQLDPAYVSSDRDAARLHYFTHYAFVSGNVAVRDLADHAPANYIRALL
jgi:pimeloyl-ACP methyl ester carboxylesterase